MPDHDFHMMYHHHYHMMYHHDFHMMYHHAFPFMPMMIMPLILFMFVTILITRSLRSSTNHSSETIDSQRTQHPSLPYEQGYRLPQASSQFQADLPEIGQAYDYERP